MIKKTFVRTAALLCAMALLIPTNTISAEAKIPAAADYDKFMNEHYGYNVIPGLESTKKTLDAAISIASKATGAPHEKVKYLHDELCKRVTYDKEAESCWSAYGALVNGKAKCIGYADAFSILCDLADIPCRQVDGSVSAGGHAWNIVQLEDGQWYEVDCTYDDVESSYNWFLITTDQMNKDHTRNYNYSDMKDCPIAYGGVYANCTSAPSSQNENAQNISASTSNSSSANTNKDTYEQYDYNGANYWVNARRNSAYLNKLPNNASKFTVPDTINYNGQEIKVDKINAFILNSKNRKKLKSITIGSNITEIQEGTFKGCKKLKKVEIKSTYLTKIGKRAFKDTHENIKVKVPSAQKKAYKKMLKKAGISKKARIK